MWSIAQPICRCNGQTFGERTPEVLQDFGLTEHTAAACAALIILMHQGILAECLQKQKQSGPLSDSFVPCDRIMIWQTGWVVQPECM